MNRDHFTCLSLLIILLASNSAIGQDSGNKLSVCLAPLDIPPRPVVDQELQPGAMAISADSSESIEAGITHLEGNVEISRNSQQVRADIIDIDQARETVDLSGNVNYWDNEIYLHGQSAHIEFANETARMSDTDYRILANRGRGKADELYVIANKMSVGRGIDYTTCDPDGSNPSLATNAWKLSAGEITLNHATGRGVGRNVVLKIKDIPVFYTPYISFPLNNERKSGFLTPEFGNTRRNGFELQTPFYWNIAPNMDATLTPRLISDSGLMLMGEYRYQFESGTGYINAEYLPSDSNFNDEDRSYISLEHTQTFAHNGKLQVIFNNLSDKRYHEDFGPSLDITSLASVDRFADLSFAGENWSVFARVQDFQTINRSNPFALNPYKRLPQIGFNYTSPRTNRAFNFKVDSEFVYFKRNETDPTGVQTTSMLGFPAISIQGSVPPAIIATFVNLDIPVLSAASGVTYVPTNVTPNILLPDIDGTRFDINPSVSYPIRTVSSFIEPKLGVRYTAYNLDGAGPFDDTPDRFLPYASLDGGFFLERELNLFGDDHIQTLEPRIYYLYTPKENQDDLPVFDTGLYDDSFDSLFYENRFSGVDRINDANRVTLSMTSRLINNQGREMGYLSIGQIYYLDKQEITLPGQVIQDQDLSPLVFEIGTNLSEQLALTAGWQWEPNGNRMQKVDLQARYRSDTGKILNIAYRVRQAVAGAIRTDAIDIEQTDISFRWPIANNWNVVGRWIYALEENKSLDIFGGIEYDSCCWGLRLVGRRFVSNIEGDVQTGIFMQIELKGLAGIGQKAVDFLYQNIPGYQNEF